MLCTGMGAADRAIEQNLSGRMAIDIMIKGTSATTGEDYFIYCTGELLGKKVKLVPYLSAYTKNKFQVE